MSNTATEPQIPASIKIGEIEYSVEGTPELKNLVSLIKKEVSATEKTKLYTKIEELKREVEALNKVSIEPQVGTPEDIGKLKEGILSEVKEMFNTYVDPLLKKSKEDTEFEVAAYRNKLLTENQTTCIPELVVGSTKEELDAALQSSIELRSKYTVVAQAPSTQSTTPAQSVTTKGPDIVANAPAANQAVPATNPATAPAATAPVVIPVPAVTDNPTQRTTDVKTMSQKQFAENRERLQEELKVLVG